MYAGRVECCLFLVSHGGATLRFVAFPAFHKPLRSTQLFRYSQFIQQSDKIWKFQFPVLDPKYFEDQRKFHVPLQLDDPTMRYLTFMNAEIKRVVRRTPNIGWSFSKSIRLHSTRRFPTEFRKDVYRNLSTTEKEVLEADCYDDNELYLLGSSSRRQDDPTPRRCWTRCTGCPFSRDYWLQGGSADF